MTSNAAKAESARGVIAQFPTTHWSVVLRARDRQSRASGQALEKLCRAYWFPLYAHLRRCGHSVEDAQDLTQGFFEQFLDKDFLAAAEPERGRFRSFLLSALKHYVSKIEGEPTPERGGRSKTYYLVSSKGREALKASLKMYRLLWGDLSHMSLEKES